MRAIHRAFRSFAVAMLLLVGVAAAMPLGVAAQPGNNGGLGNSGAAQQCKQGGWQSLSRDEDGIRHIPFASQGECVSHGAQGGNLTTTSPIYLVLDGACGVHVYVTTPITSYAGEIYVDGVSASVFMGSWTVGITHITHFSPQPNVTGDYLFTVSLSRPAATASFTVPCAR